MYAVYLNSGKGRATIVEYDPDQLFPWGPDTWQNLAPGPHYDKIATYASRRKAQEHVDMYDRELLA